MFENRLQAGQKLADALEHYHGDPSALVLAIPRGGVMTGYVVSKHLEIPLEVELIKKIAHPDNKDFSIGAVSLESGMFSDQSDISTEYLHDEKKKALKELKKRHKLYFGDREIIHLLGKKVILVDDGIATGNTINMAIRLIKTKKPLKIILATPVAPIEVIDNLANMVDEIVCLEKPSKFNAVGEYYRQFHTVNDKTVVRLLQELREVRV